MAYRSDDLLREAWRTAVSVLGTSSHEVLMRTGMLLFKPEAIRVGRAGEVIDRLCAEGYTVRAMFTTDLSWLATHLIWRYQLPLATADRIRLQTRYRPNTHTLCVFVTLERMTRVPTSVRLFRLRGPAKVALQHHGHLRGMLSCSNNMLNYLHTPAEPIDLVRDIAALRSPARQQELWLSLSDDSSSVEWATVHREIERLERQGTAHDGCPVRSWRRILHLVPPRQFQSMANLVEDIESIMLGGSEKSVTLDAFEVLLSQTSGQLDQLDVFIAGTHVIEHDRCGVENPVSDDDIWKWGE